jgi:ATP-binding cassette subfamily C protein
MRLLLLSLIVGTLGLLTPIITGLLFDLAIPGGHRSLLLQLGTGLAVCALASATFQAVCDVAIVRLSGRIQATVEPALLDRLLELPVAFFRRYPAGDLVGRARAIGSVRETLVGPLLSATVLDLFGLLGVVLLFTYAPGLAVVATGLTAALAVVLAVGCRLHLRHQRCLGDQTGRLAGTVLQLICGISKLRVAGAEGRAFSVWAEQLAGQRRAAYQARTVANGLTIFLAAYPLLASTALFGVAVLGLASNLSVGGFLGFFTAFGLVTRAVIRLGQAGTALCQAAPAYERARPILDTRPEVDTPRTDPGELDGAVQVNGVSFRYGEDGPLVLDDVSIACRPGELVALVGPSGSGKSTLVRLLLGFEAPRAGAILYDGQDLAGLDVRAVRRQIGVVLQDGRLLAGDIVSNIVGASTLTLDHAWEAARLAGLDEEIRQLPMGMHTVLSEGCGTLSGGQQQRLMIARAIVHRPRILLFDEATSALDNQSQATVARSLERLSATRLVIAHRLSTVVSADRIYVLDRGRIVEHGTYNDLMDRGGLFASLARRQLS